MTQFTLSAFADEASSEFDRQIAALHRKHIPLMEIRGVDGKGILDLTDEELDVVEKKLAAGNISISAIGSPIGKIGIEDDFAPHFEKFKRAVEIAKKLHTTRIRMFSFYIPENYAAADCRSEVLFRMEAMVAEAAHNNITLLHENEKGIYGDNASRCLDLMQQFAGKHFSCTFDFANFIQCGQDPSEAYEMLSPGKSARQGRALCYRRSRSGRHRRRTSAGNFPKARRFRLSRLFEPRAAFSQFQRSCSIRTQRCDSHRKQHGKGVLRCLGGIPESAGITSKSCPYGSSFSWHLIVFLIDFNVF